MSIGVAIPGDRNVIKKEAEKISKCKNLITKIQRMRNAKERGNNMGRLEPFQYHSDST